MEVNNSQHTDFVRPLATGEKQDMRRISANLKVRLKLEVFVLFQHCLRATTELRKTKLNVEMTNVFVYLQDI